MRKGGNVARTGGDGSTATTAPNNGAAPSPPAFPKRTGRADIHMHTDMGDGLHSPAAILDHAERETELDLIAVTDHDDITAALVAQDLAAKRGGRVQVIPGTEISTRGGHVLALFVERDFPLYGPLDATLAAIHEAGGVAVAPHPLSWLTTAVSTANLRRIVALGDAGKRGGVYFDGIETLNPSIAGRVAYERTLALNRDELHLPPVAGSDAHAKHLTGTAYTSFPGSTPDDFRAALAAATTRAHGRFWTLRETGEIAGESTYRAWFILPVRRVRRLLNERHAARAAVRETSAAPAASVQAGKHPAPDRERVRVGSGDGDGNDSSGNNGSDG